MLLTITYEGKETQDLGYLLHKNPQRAQQFELTYGKAYVFYPEVSDEKTTAALLLDIDPIDLAKGKLGSKDGGLFDYVNDRPYASTSFMSTAISKVFGTAMSGTCKKKPELVDQKLKLTAKVYALRDNRNETLSTELFEPLGYEVKSERKLLDEKFPEWGISPYINLTISGEVRLCDLLNHLYVLIPVFDRQKHYYYSEDEIQKLLDHGKGWLEDHPQKERIAHRYLAKRKRYALKAIDVLTPEELIGEDEDEEAEDDKEERIPLNTLRMGAVFNEVINSGALSVIDLGCGEGRLTKMLLENQQIKKVTAVDVSIASLEKAAKRLKLDRMSSFRKNKLNLIQGSVTYKDSRFEGYDCACLVEVLEHIDPSRIPVMEKVVFGYAKPQTVIITTPNREYNVNYEHMKENALRHSDHRFEWSRKEFKEWTNHICKEFGYRCEIKGIGEEDSLNGAPTQMGVFSKDE